MKPPCMGVSWGFPEVATLTVHPLQLEYHRVIKSRPSKSCPETPNFFGLDYKGLSNSPNWSQNIPLGGILAPISITRCRFVKFSSKICCQVALQCQIITPGGSLVQNFCTSMLCIALYKQLTTGLTLFLKLLYFQVWGVFVAKKARQEILDSAGYGHWSPGYSQIA